eukprot:GHUV01002327.1.p1 GENE.GHUV01002327.1~~GHUV01002327.1.p1  ORF type:complete len:742 (+),score=159.31 GHUV01002327.1:153-2378(+)
MPRSIVTAIVIALAVASADAVAIPQPSGKRDVLLWQVQLTPDQCSGRQIPCLNIYAVNQTQGDLLWYAYTTASSAVKAMSVGRHSVYYTTWSGPGLYTVKADTGHVRWQFPLDNWFRYWVKDIDLPPSASFSYAEEVREHVYATAAGPPSRLYGLKTKTGARQWEFKCPVASAVLADLAGPYCSRDSKAKTVFLAYSNPSNNSSWLQGLDITSGSSTWRSADVNNTSIDRVEMLDSHQLLATSAAGDTIMSFNSSNGALLWQQQVQYCTSPSPIADVRSGRLLLPRSCDSMQDLAVIDAYTGEALWDSWEIPSAAPPTGNCTWVSVKDSSIYFGCSCNITARGRHAQQPEKHAQSQPGGSSTQSISSNSTSGDAVSRGVPAAVQPNQQWEQGICMYAVSSRSGRLEWAQARAGNATFPAGAQTWGMAPMVHQGLAVFLASDQLFAVETRSGKLAWSYKLEASETLPAWQLPVLDYATNVIILTAQRANKTAVTAVDFDNGKLMWRRMMNGTAQPPRGLVAGAEQLWLSGGGVYVEACRGKTCCLRALNVTSGKQKWGMCLQAERGEDATHPHAQFAIWIITVVTIGSIALLIAGACLLYVHRWTEERRILDGANGGMSPRHSYRPLPDGAAGSDSDREDTIHRYQAMPQVPAGPPQPPHLLEHQSMSAYQRPPPGYSSSNNSTGYAPAADVAIAAAAAGIGGVAEEVPQPPQQQQQSYLAGTRRVGGPRDVAAAISGPAGV